MELITGGELFDRICEKEKYTEREVRTKAALGGIELGLGLLDATARLIGLVAPVQARDLLRQLAAGVQVRCRVPPAHH
jgi:hypothetical protein